MTQTRPFELLECEVSDEAATYVADMLMHIALQFEATYFTQIRRHYQSLRPQPDDTAGQQLDLFDKHRPF